MNFQNLYNLKCNLNLTYENYDIKKPLEKPEALIV